jgi:hypothetical protein
MRNEAVVVAISGQNRREGEALKGVHSQRNLKAREHHG